MNPVLVVLALPAEGQGVFEAAGVTVLYTGVGKVNAAYALTRELTLRRAAGAPAPVVVNFGTAGSRRFPTGSVAACHTFLQRDMDATGLGFGLGETPFEDGPHQLVFEPLFVGLPEGVCGSGDSFATVATGLTCDVVDMEAYALAKVCRSERVRFGSVKYVTDGHDHAAATDWHANLPRAAQVFWDAYVDLVRRLGG